MLVDGRTIDSPTYEVDCYKNQIALEIEWNNKDPFFDRDLNNFRLLFDLRAISVGWTSWGNEVDEAPPPPKPVEERVGQLILLEQRRNYRTKRKTS